MAERRVINKYYPSDYDPLKGSLNTFVKNKRRGIISRDAPVTDILENEREMNTRLPSQGAKKSRFELPFNVWCLGCSNHIGMGVRYDAAKRFIKMYYSTPVFSFKFTCHLCPQEIEIQTDPENTQYKIISGCRKKIEFYDQQDIGIAPLMDPATKEKLQTNAFFRLEQQEKDLKTSLAKKTTLTMIQDDRDQFWKDPYTMNQKARRKFRNEKKLNQALKDEAEQVKEKLHLSIDVAKPDISDVIGAKQIDWESRVAPVPAIKKDGIFKTRKKKVPTAKQHIMQLVAKAKTSQFSTF